jgi:hypothetical protein
MPGAKLLSQCWGKMLRTRSAVQQIIDGKVPVKEPLRTED